MTFGSPIRSTGSEDEDDEIFLSPEKQAGDEIIMEWARVGFLCFLCLEVVCNSGGILSAAYILFCDLFDRRIKMI